jgi:hypothetical protein
VSQGPTDTEGGITMWGAPTTGKTTFLAALNVALLLKAGRWRVRGVDKVDADALTRLAVGLNEDRIFPEATSAIAEYHWELRGSFIRTVKRGIFRPAEYVEEPVVIPLNLVDAAGGSAHPLEAGSPRWTELLDSLARSRGILFLFDPVREFSHSDAFVHTVGVVNELNQRMKDSALPDGRLPHHVAVCIAKFDEIEVLRTAQQLNLVYYDPDHWGCPKVHEDDAREFFAHLCDVSDSGEARIVPKLLEQTFRADRLRYFVTSSIGFYIDRNTGVFDFKDYQNYVEANTNSKEPAPPRIRGTVDPINVVEPVLWLGESLAREAGAGQ